MPISSPRSLSILVLALAATVCAPSAFADQFYNSGGRADFFDNGGSIRAKNAPDLLLLNRVPDLYDPSGGPFQLGCFLQARKADGFTLISGVKARYTAHLAVLNLADGTFTMRRIATGKTKTGNPGTTFFFDVAPSEFEPGLPDSYLAFIQLSLEMKNKKALNGLTAICDSSTRLTN